MIPPRRAKTQPVGGARSMTPGFAGPGDLEGPAVESVP